MGAHSLCIRSAWFGLRGELINEIENGRCLFPCWNELLRNEIGYGKCSLSCLD